MLECHSLWNERVYRVKCYLYFRQGIFFDKRKLRKVQMGSISWLIHKHRSIQVGNRKNSASSQVVACVPPNSQLSHLIFLLLLYLRQPPDYHWGKIHKHCNMSYGKIFSRYLPTPWGQLLSVQRELATRVHFVGTMKAAWPSSKHLASLDLRPGYISIF